MHIRVEVAQRELAVLSAPAEMAVKVYLAQRGWVWDDEGPQHHGGLVEYWDEIGVQRRVYTQILYRREEN